MNSDKYLTPMISPLKNLRVKMEHLNPGGSHKSRAARQILERAIAEGKIKPGGHRRIIEKSGGNFGVGLAYEASKFDIAVDLVIGLSFPPLKRALCEEYGARLIGLELLKQGYQPKEVIEKTLRENPEQYFFTDQFANPANFEAHLNETGPELIKQLGRDITEYPKCTIVLGAGTGAHAAALNIVMRENFSHVQLVLVQPENCSFKDEQYGDHAQKGVAVGVTPPFLDLESVDSIITVLDVDAFDGQRKFARDTGFYPGPSSGANYKLAHEIAKSSPDRLVITMIYDAGEGYLDQRIIA